MNSQNKLTDVSTYPPRLKFTSIKGKRPSNSGLRIYPILPQENRKQTNKVLVILKSPVSTDIKRLVDPVGERPGPPVNLRSKKKQVSHAIIYYSILYLIRLSILGIGIAVIAGTVLSAVDSTKYKVADGEEKSTKVNIDNAQPDNKQQSFSLTKEIALLKAKVEELAKKWPKLELGAFFLDLDSGAYVNIQGSTPFSAASTIKIPILVAFFQEVDRGNITLDEMLTMKPELIALHSGTMQYQKPGTKFTALETATKTIVISDNTGTNMLVERIGGAQVLNQRFRDWGLTGTVIRNPLPDLEGTNTTSPRDLVRLLGMVNRGELLTLRSRDRLLGIMKQTKTRTLLPQSLGPGAIIAHKTGDIGSVLGDAGIVDMPNGKRYIVAVMVKRPHNDYTARTLIQQISKAFYQYLEQPNPNPEEEKKDEPKKKQE